MAATCRLRPTLLALTTAVLAISAAGTPLSAQGNRGGPIADAQQLDRDGRFAGSRVIYRAVLDTISDPADRAAVQRRMAMSHGFEGDCAGAVRYHEMVIEYWMTREDEEPQNAFYQEGEMANESARVCVDSGAFDEAERMYRRGYELGNMEPEPRTHPRSLWDFRLAHALGRINARRGNADEAWRQVELARAALDGDPEMARQQERFYPYLAGYVALYTGDLDRAVELFTGMLEMGGNQRDPFMHTLLAIAYEEQGRVEEAGALYRQAYEMAGRAHNPPAAFTRRFVREKLEIM